MKFLKDNWKLLALLASALVIYSYPALLVPVASSTAAVILTSYLSKVFGLFSGKKAVSTQEAVKEVAASNDNADVTDCSTSKMVAELSANDENIAAPVVAADAPVVAADAPVVAADAPVVAADADAPVVAAADAPEHLSVSSSDDEADEEVRDSLVAGR